MRRLWLLLVVAMTTIGTQADVLPSSYYSEPGAGTFYLYNVATNQFLERLSTNFPNLSTAPNEVKLTKKGTGYTIMFADGKYLKTGFWNDQYLWTDGTADLTEAVWTFEAISGKDKVYQLKRTTQDTWNEITGIFYVNGTNAATEPTDDCQWALISPATYIDIARNNAIPAKYRSTIPTAEGQYYLYDMLNQTFLDTDHRSLSNEPKVAVTFTPTDGNKFLISGSAGKYLKIGVYKGQYLWSDGDATSTKWTVEAPSGAEADKLYFIYTDDFAETNAEVKDKTMYLNGTNATATKPDYARWALIKEADYVDYLSSGEGTVDHAAAASNKQTMIDAMGDATGLLQNPTFERSADGWWGGERTLSALYRGSGYSLTPNPSPNGEGSVMLQTVKNMPRGTYKVVAAVRGDNGTTVSARVADNNGDAVVNAQVTVHNAQLNMNGVKMPYSTVGGFSTGEDARGWVWAVATGTLSDDGHLRVEFVTAGTGKVSVADVHLYYMGDGTNTYAVEYADGVDAAAHAVTCDLTAENPNKLFTSNGTIKTSTGEKLNNNLVGGTVANLVLYDGYDFAAKEDFIANKATFYGSIEAGVPTAICLPFAITGGTKGTFYEVKSQDGSTLKMREVKKPEAAKAYIYRGTEATTTLTGSGNVKAVPVETALSTIISKFGTAQVSGVKLDFDVEDDGVWQKPQVTVSDFVAGQECYLYNVGAARFYTEGNSYGTQASIGETGLKVKFVQNGSAVKITNYSEAKKAWRTMFVTTSGAMYVDGDGSGDCNWSLIPGADKTFKLMISSPNSTYNQENYPGAMMGLDLFEYDLQTRLAALLFTDEEPGEGIYLTDWAVVSTADYDSYQTAVATYKTALQLKNLIDEAQAAGIDIAAEQTVYENTASTQEELTAAIVSIANKMIEDELKGASRENPLDLTDKFVLNPRYENNDNEGWQGTAPGIDVTGNLQNAEFFNKEKIDYYQDLVGLPDGTYRLSVLGFYRAGLEGPAVEAKKKGTEESVMHAKLYVSANGKTNTAKIQSVFTGAPSTGLGVNGEIHLDDWWVPNTMSSAAAYFAAGYYNENSIEVEVSGGIRDPHILRGEDGCYYIVATDMNVMKNGWTENPGIVLMKSRDLVNWTHGKINLGKDWPRFSDAYWVWAPQTIYDRKAKKYMIYFTLQRTGDGRKSLITYYAYANKDFTAFESEPKQLFSAKYGSIDNDIIYKDGTYHLFYKGNTKDERGKEVKNGIQQAISKSLKGPWKEDFEYLDAYAGTRTHVEGSSVFKTHPRPLPVREGQGGESVWVLMYDLYSSGRYEYQTSKDLIHWTKEPQSFRKDFFPRHGSVISVTKDELEHVQQKWGRVLTHEFESAGNPIIRDKYTADPAVLVEGDTLWLFAGHDAAGGQSGYVMKDWLLYSTTDMKHWTEHPSPLRIEDFAWAKSKQAYAGHVAKGKDGRYYWYVSTNWCGIGVAVSDDIKGPYKDALGKPLLTNEQCFASKHSWACIDPAIFIDSLPPSPSQGGGVVKTQAYIIWGNKECYYAKLKDNMMEIDGEVHQIDVPRFTEAPWVHKYKGKYYLTYASEWPEKIAYAVSDHIGGPYTPMGIISEIAGNSNTTHPAIVEFKGRWLFFSHNGGLSDGTSYSRSVIAEPMYYNADGSIRFIPPTATGVASF